MLESLQVVTGLRNGAVAESLLLEALEAQGIRLDVRRLNEPERMSGTLERCNHVLFVLPIMGDNDITDELLELLRRFVAAAHCDNRAVLVAAKGDRHVSDEFVSLAAPFGVKLHNLFSAVGAFRILETKLDTDTAMTVAREVADVANSLSATDVAHLSELTRLLPERPLWQPHKRLLDFYSPGTGFSLLKGQNVSALQKVAGCIVNLAPRVLTIRDAGLVDDTLPGIASALCAEVIDLGSNALTLPAAAPVLVNCRWLSMAANQLTHADLSVLPASVEKINLQKNMLGELSLDRAHGAQFSEVSLYRNRLAELEWPDDQVAITRLNVGANPLERLPDSLANARYLRSLGVARTGLKRLPEWIFHLPQIRELDISYIENVLPVPQIGKLRQMGVALITRPGHSTE
ncbi:hypothetical protein [Paraburkholderia domus]|uniref:Leucine-rich repeat domain-containing protein n=1 Tax=Paraburkholderia domus TaxID=2793075 RepID=A0A9N8N6N4_9BURK|nr:hypothetical protein [Paraburkholderia domus]MBK5169463.1 hypothetical protein [Burkholderia sp. R-70211]CAE6959453.1 hypothetical protein R70211_06831 [Paraburkholderia domus]